jgi:GT2 family glycosyltransferase
MPKIAVVMLVRDRGRLTVQALTSLLFNTSAQSQLFITIVDDASKVPFAYSAPNIHIIRNDESKGTAYARNLGVAHAKQFNCDFLYLSDNDVWFSPLWDLVLHEALQRYESIGIIGGWNHPYHQSVDCLGDIFAFPGAHHSIITHEALAGPSWLLRWGLWDKFGKLSEGGLGVCQGEDCDYGERVTAGGYYLASVVPPVVVSCGLTNTFGHPAPGAELMKRMIPKGVYFE